MPLIIPSLLLSSCMILGDSIAQGVAQHLPKCETRSFVGISTANWLKVYTNPAVADTVIISLGSNDKKVPSTLLETQLNQVRSQVMADQVIWLLCNQPQFVRRLVSRIAHENRDIILDTRPVISIDHIHPTSNGYRRLARQIQGLIQRLPPAASWER